VTGLDKPGLVGDRDELGAVAHSELVERPADVGLRRRAADDQPVGDLVVAQARRHERHHLALARSQLLELLLAWQVWLGLGGELRNQTLGGAG
jgi:hypothetical protein